MGYFRDNIEEMAAYVPGAQPDDMASVVKLNQNENPYPPSPEVARVLGEFAAGELRLYPDPLAGGFCEVAAEVLDVPAEWICVGDGSDDLIIMICRAATGRDRAVVVPTPTFPYFATQAEIENAPLVAVDAGEDFSLPIDALAAADGAVTFLANPNSPTGAMADNDQVRYLAGKLSGLLIVDEAYVDFADHDALALAAEFDNVIVLRTLSKGYSLAGLRLGLAVTPPALKTELLKTKGIYNVGPLPAAMGAAAMADQTYHGECVDKIVSERTRLDVEFSRRGFDVWPSQGNFLMVNVPGGDGRAAYEGLKARDVLVRYFSKPRMTDKLRISVGTHDQNTALLSAVDAAGIGSQP